MAMHQIFYLEQYAVSEIKAKPKPAGIELRECVVKQWMFNRFLYQWVGSLWQWHDKLPWSDQEWQRYAESDDLRTWVAYVEGSPAGYFELKRYPDYVVQIMYFGLGEAFLNKGLGGYLLTQALQCAWGWRARRVDVNTCSLDHPSALKNYLARGMTLARTETVAES